MEMLTYVCQLHWQMHSNECESYRSIYWASKNERWKELLLHCCDFGSSLFKRLLKLYACQLYHTSFNNDSHSLSLSLYHCLSLSIYILCVRLQIHAVIKWLLILVLIVGFYLMFDLCMVIALHHIRLHGLYDSVHTDCGA